MSHFWQLAVLKDNLDAPVPQPEAPDAPKPSETSARPASSTRRGARAKS